MRHQQVRRPRDDDDDDDHGITAVGSGSPTNGSSRREYESDEPQAKQRMQYAGLTNPFTQLQYSQRYYQLKQVTEKLPAFASKANFLAAVRAHQVVLVEGETGSGKTTQLPKYVLELGSPLKIAVTQPRRVAAITVAHRIAEELDVQLGKQVGYKVRFDEKCGDDTRILLQTDGMLLRAMQQDPDLRQYGTIIIDEAHERSTDSDMCIALVKLLAQRRPELRVIVMSATLERERFRHYFTRAPLVEIEGRNFDVTLHYTDRPVTDYVKEAIIRAKELHLTEPISAGDILVFLTGQGEIEMCTRQVAESLPHGGRKAVCLPLYGNLPLDQQKRVFNRPEKDTRRIIFATNIAETSLTIDGIGFVVDCGHQKSTIWNAEHELHLSAVTAISKAAAKQRAGRAGRTSNGHCYRLYPESAYNKMQAQTYAEVLRTDLSSVVLQLKALPIGVELVKFPWIESPPPALLTQALLLLQDLEATDNTHAITDTGRIMLNYPLPVRYARALAEANLFGCVLEVCVICAMAEADRYRLMPPKRLLEAKQAHSSFEHPAGDHMTMLNVFSQYLISGRSPRWAAEHFFKPQALDNAHRIFLQLKGICERQGSVLSTCFDEKRRAYDDVRIRRALTAGFLNNVAYLPPDGVNWVLPKSDKVIAAISDRSVLHQVPVSALKSRWVIFQDLTMETRRSRDGMAATNVTPTMTTVSPIDPQWLFAINESLFDPGQLENEDAARFLDKLCGAECRQNDAELKMGVTMMASAAPAATAATSVKQENHLGGF